MNSSLAVIDSNIAVYTVTGTQSSQVAADLLQRLRGAEVHLYAPRLWVYEVVSSIHKHFQAGYLLPDDAEDALTTALAFDINLLEDTPALCQSAFRWATRLGQMPAYDSFYLAAAEQLDAPLWTADKRLASAAKQLGVGWVHWMGDVE